MEKQILSCVSEIMKLMIEAGAEIYRAEESGERMLKAYGADVCDVYATTSNIIISIENEEDIKTHTRRIKKISTDMDRVDRLNTLVRKISKTPLSVLKLKKR